MADFEPTTASDPAVQVNDFPPAGRALLVVGRTTTRDEPLRRSLRQTLAVAEFVARAEDADRLLPRCHFDCVVVEVDSASDPALRWIERVQRSGAVRQICGVVPDDPALASAVLQAGATSVLAKPLDAGSLRRLLAAPVPADRHHRAERRDRAATRLPLQIIGDSRRIRQVRDIVERVAPTPATVLIEGQTGTGKELIARLVHERSGRRGPFVPVNCGAIPPELMESELFGHAKGAFTGAHQHRDGLFVAAQGGTLFLDEVSEMRGDLQVKLLRALEESRIRPVGTDREIAIDVRIVASAQPGLIERIRERRFREDLYYRLNVVHVLLPDLRERRDDIPLLVRHFMQQVADEFGMAPVALDAAQLERLRARDWPGNVRELRNYVERAVLMGVPPEEELAAAGGDPQLDDGTYPIEWTLEQVKQAHILRVLEHNGGNRSAAARQLGVSRKTLERRLGPGGERDALES